MQGLQVNAPEQGQAPRVGIGESRRTESGAAGREAAARARDGLGGQPPGWVLAFCGGRHDPAAFLAGLRAELGEIPVVGGAAVGTITAGLMGVSGYECALALFSATLEPRFLLSEPLCDDLHGAGLELGRRLAAAAGPDNTVLLFYDSVHDGGPPPKLHTASRLMDGLNAAFGDEPPMVVGAGTLQYFALTESYIFDGRGAAKHRALAVVLPPGLLGRHTIMHGCVPASAFLEITRIEGAQVYELDHRPAVEVLAERVGRDPGALLGRELSMLLTLGEKHGDPFMPFDETRYVNRLVIASDTETGAVTLFEADYRPGTRVQVMVTDAERLNDSVAARTRELVQSLAGLRVLFGLYFDCAARASAFSGVDREDAEVLLENLGPGVPLLGFYSGVEIAPLLGQPRPLDWTGVLTLFTLRE